MDFEKLLTTYFDMEAPKKIYVSIGPRQSLITRVGQTLKSDIEYIRKDALMKIIETARESAIIQRNFNNYPAKQEARIDAYDYIKHKIESL